MGITYFVSENSGILISVDTGKKEVKFYRRWKPEEFNYYASYHLQTLCKDSVFHNYASGDREFKIRIEFLVPLRIDVWQRRHVPNGQYDRITDLKETSIATDYGNSIRIRQ